MIESSVYLVLKSKTWSGHKLQGRTEIQGLQISIENKKGTYREGVDKDGHKWRTLMYYPYGYIRLTEGTDGDHVDCYIGPEDDAEKVYIVHQNDPTTGEYDEDKILLNFNSAEEAKAAYLRQYDKPDFFGSMDEVGMEKFKTMLDERKGLKLKKSIDLAKAKFMKAPAVTRKQWAGKWYIWKQGIGWRPEPKGRMPAAPQPVKKKRGPAKPDTTKHRGPAKQKPTAPAPGSKAERNTKILKEITEGGKVKEIAEKYKVSRGRIHRLLVDARKAGVKISSRQISDKINAEKINEAFDKYEHRELGAARRDSIARNAGEKTAANQPYKEKDKIIVGRASYTQLPDNEYVPEDIGRTLKQHQRDFVNLGIQKFMEGKHGVACFDGTGAGKTMEELALAEVYRTQSPGATILITTESTRIVNNAFLKDGATLKIGAKLITKADEITGPGIYITRYMDLKAVQGKFKDINLAIFDEAHNMKNPAISMKAKLGMKLMETARNNAVFTATPIDKPTHIHYLCDSFNLDYKKVMKFLGYQKQNMAGHKVWGTNQSAKEVAERLDAVFHTFTEQGLMVKREVPMDGMDLNFKNAELSPEHMVRYEKAIGDMKADVDAAEPKARGLTKAIWLMRIRGMLEEAKIPHAINAIDEALKKGRQVVMFATRVNDTMIRKIAQATGSAQAVAKADEFIKFAEGTLKKMGEQLKAKGIDFTPVFGSNKKAMNGIKDFQAGKTKVLLTTPQSGGTGISLDDQVGNAPRTMVMMTPPFSAVDFIQIMGRGHRLSTKSRTETVLVGTNTYVDMWNRGIIANKLSTLGASVKGDYEALSMEDLEAVENMNPTDAAKFLDQKRKETRQTQSAAVKSVPPFDMSSYASLAKAFDLAKKFLFELILRKARGKKDPVGTERGGRRKGLDERWRKVKVIDHRYLTMNELRAYALKENVEAFVDDWIDPEYWVAAKEEWLSKPFDKRFPIVIDPHGFILDGNHRYRVFKAAGRLNEVSILQMAQSQWEKIARRFPSSSTMNYGVEEEDDPKFYAELRKQGKLLVKARGIKEPIGTIKVHADGTARKKIDEGKWRPLGKTELETFKASLSKDSTSGQGTVSPAQKKNPTRAGELVAFSGDELKAIQKMTEIRGRIFSGQQVQYNGRGRDNGQKGVFVAMGKSGMALIRFPDGHITESPFRELVVQGETKPRSVYEGLDPLNVRKLPSQIKDVIEGFMEQKIGKTQITLNDVAKKFNERGFTLSLVGGAIRDLLEGKTPGDLDFVVDCSDNEIKHFVGELNPMWLQNATTNPVIGLVSFEGLDITPNHMYVNTKELHGEFKGGTYKQDAECRDFTVNSMHLDLLHGYLIDSTGRGLEDLKTRTLSIPNTGSFKNNQVLRYFKFVARGYKATSETVNVVRERFQSAVDKQSDARLKGFFVRQIAMKDGIAGLNKVKALMLEMDANAFVGRMENAWNQGKMAVGHVLKKALEFISLFMTVREFAKARGVKVPIGTIHNGRVKLGEGKWRPVKAGGGRAIKTAQVATYPTLRKYAVMSLREMESYAKSEHNVDLANVTQESRSAWHAVLYQLDLLKEMGLRNRTHLTVKLLEMAKLQDGHSISSAGEKVLAAYNPSLRTILLSHKFKESFVHEFMHHLFEHLGNSKKDARRKFVRMTKQTDAYKDFEVKDVDLSARFMASDVGKGWKSLGITPDKNFYYTKPTEMAAYYGAEYVYQKWLSLVMAKKITNEVNMSHGGGVGHYVYRDLMFLKPYFEDMMFAKLRKAIEDMLKARRPHKPEIVDEQGKHYRYNEATKKFEYVKKGRQTYPFVLSLEQASWWCAKSAVKQTLLHVTDESNVMDIAQHGFSIKKRAWGRLWGDGVYVCSPSSPLEHMKAIKAWAVLHDNPIVLKLKIDVRKVLDVDTERAIQSVYQTSAGEKAFFCESEYIANLAGTVEEYRKEVQRLDHLVQRAFSERPDAEGIKPTERIIVEETGVDDLLDLDPRAFVLAKVLKAKGYDAIHIRSPEFKIATGGAQYVVLNPLSIRIFGKAKLET